MATATDQAADIRDLVRGEARGWRLLSGRPDLLRAFLLDHGRFWAAGNAYTPRGEPKWCFRNAACVATDQEAEGWLYVEGLAFRPDGAPIAIHHAWLMAPSGHVYDPTWNDPEACQYLGVTMEPDTVRRRLLETGYWGALDPAGFGVDLEWLDRVWGWHPDTSAHIAQEG